MKEETFQSKLPDLACLISERYNWGREQRWMEDKEKVTRKIREKEKKGQEGKKEDKSEYYLFNRGGGLIPSLGRLEQGFQEYLEWMKDESRREYPGGVCGSHPNALAGIVKYDGKWFPEFCGRIKPDLKEKIRKMYYYSDGIELVVITQEYFPEIKIEGCSEGYLTEEGYAKAVGAPGFMKCEECREKPLIKEKGKEKLCGNYYTELLTKITGQPLSQERLKTVWEGRKIPKFPAGVEKLRGELIRDTEDILNGLYAGIEAFVRDNLQ